MNKIWVLASVLIVSALVAGCGAKRSNPSAADSATRLSADELARLLDFHAWKTGIPQTQQPSKGVRLVLVKPDGTAVWVFSSGTTDPPELWSSMLVGLRFERGAFSGTLEAYGSNRVRTSWNLSFAHPLAGSIRSWYGGHDRWESNRFRLATVWSSGVTNDFALRESDNYNILAVQLLK
jgi:hypothetical protein